jgi:hypothetical protein
MHAHLLQLTTGRNRYFKCYCIEKDLHVLNVPNLFPSVRPFFINNTSLEKGQPQEIFDKFVIRELSPFRLLSRKLSFENLLLSILYI